jgi:DNA-binding transcriptional MerR regulator
MRRAGGRRYYRPFDLDVLRGVRALLYGERYTTKGVQKIFRDHGVKYVAEIGRMAGAGAPLELRPLVDEDSEDRASFDRGDADHESLGAPSLSPADLEAIPEPVRERLGLLLARLERAAEALDEATLAIEAIDAEE